METVLIAEDDLAPRMILSTYMTKYKDKFKTILVSDGLEAINILKSQPISLLVTDLKMPRVEGLVLLAYMNKNYPNTPCIVMTSLKKKRLKEKLQKDVLKYIEKPFKPEELAAVILDVFEEEIPGESLHGISVVSFLQLIHMEHKTCICEIQKDDIQGVLYFEDGELYNAVCGELKGAAAAKKLIMTEYATVNFKSFKGNSERMIQTDLTSLILEALRGKD
jgi:CheY-like chemotaxis protein